MRGAATVAALLARIHEAIEAGVDWIQIREKDLSSRGLCELAGGAVSARRERHRGNEDFQRTRILINDRLDVALAAGADGVHLGRESLPSSAINISREERVLPEDFLIGVSCHSIAEARTAESDGADYLFFGPIFDTPSKAVFGPPQGIERLHEVSSSVKIPVIAIGGITAENAAACVQAGAAGIAAIRMFQDAADLRGTVADLRTRMKPFAQNIVKEKSARGE